MIFRFAHPTLRKSAVNHFHFFYRWSQLSHNFNILKPLKAIELSYFQEKSTITFKMVRFIFNSLTLSLFLMKAAIANIIDHGKPPLGIGALGAESQEPEQRFIVTYKHGMRDSLIKDYETMSSKSNRKKLLHDFRDLESVVVTGGEDVRKGLQANPSVATVEIDEPRFPLSQQVRTNTVPRELQLDSQVIPDGVLAVQAPQVWERGFRGAGVKICIIDSGIDATHEDFDIDHLDGTSITGMWFEDATGHGTFVAGIIAARDNDRGIVGVAPESDLHVVQIGDPAGGGFTFVSDLLASLQACVDADAKIINISLGGPVKNIMERRAMKKLNRQGILVVAASGNTFDKAKTYPSSYPEVMSVGAVFANKQIADFSTFNNNVDMCAPGVNVISTLPMSGNCSFCQFLGYRYGLLDGTSMAAPHVAGVAALLWSAKPDATVDEITEAIQETAEDLGKDGKDRFYGHGFVLALDALEYLLPK